MRAYVHVCGSQRSISDTPPPLSIQGFIIGLDCKAYELQNFSLPFGASITDAPNLGLCAYVPNTLPSESSPHPSFVNFIFLFVI